MVTLLEGESRPADHPKQVSKVAAAAAPSPHARAPQSHHERPLLSPGNDANGTGSHCRSPNARGGLC